jgi:PPOX class probable F420-dependent enzyme
VGSTLDAIGQATFALVTSYRKDGRPVPTPVRVVRDGDALAVWTVAGSGKVKRIRRSGTVQIGPCDLRGKPTGDQVPGYAIILGAAGTARIRALLRQKYGPLARITLWGSRLRRGVAGTVAIRITLDGRAPGPLNQSNMD